MAECKPLLEKILECMGDNDWIAGPSITWLDFYFAELVDMLNALSDGQIYSDYPKCDAYWNRFISLPNLGEAWADDSKLMKRPFNNTQAKLLNI